MAKKIIQIERAGSESLKAVAGGRRVNVLATFKPGLIRCDPAADKKVIRQEILNIIPKRANAFEIGGWKVVNDHTTCDYGDDSDYSIAFYRLDKEDIEKVYQIGNREDFELTGRFFPAGEMLD